MNLDLCFFLSDFQAELQSIKDASSLQKKRTTEMMISLLKDLSEIGEWSLTRITIKWMIKWFIDSFDVSSSFTADPNLLNAKIKMNLLISFPPDSSHAGTVVGGNASDLKKPYVDLSDKIEEEFTVARLYVSKMKSEIKTLAVRCQNLEQFQV